jgi:hypothetical protein
MMVTGTACTLNAVRRSLNLPASLNFEVPWYAWYYQSDYVTPNSSSPARMVFML